MPDVGYLRVVNLERFQHYKDRSPPWIKLHAQTLESYEFARLQDASKAHLMLIWLLASRTGNRIPNDPIWVRNKIGAREDVNLDELQLFGFLEPEQDASNPLASRLHDARPEGEGETEERQREKPRARARRRAWGEDEQVPEEWIEWAVTETRLAPNSIRGVASEFADYWRGTGRPMADWRAVWRNWCRRQPQFERTTNGRSETAAERHTRRIIEFAQRNENGRQENRPPLRALGRDLRPPLDEPT